MEYLTSVSSTISLFQTMDLDLLNDIRKGLQDDQKDLLTDQNYLQLKQDMFKKYPLLYKRLDDIGRMMLSNGKIPKCVKIFFMQSSNSEVKFSGHLKSPLLKVKKKIKGTKFSGTPMMEGWAWCPSEILQTQVQTCPRRAYRKHLCLQLCENSGPSFGLLN